MHPTQVRIEATTVVDCFYRGCFAGGVPLVVEQVEYEINLAGFDHLRVATKPEGFDFP